jgi:hypothetical protein
MSIASVRVDNATNFIGRQYSKLMPAADKHIVKPLVADTFGVSDVVVQDAWASVMPTASIYGQTATFTIPRSVGRIYELVLEATFPGEATVTLCPYPIVKLVQGYQLNVGGNLINTTGDCMFQARQSYLSNDSKNFFSTMAGGTSGDSIVNTDEVKTFLVVDYPGSLSVNQHASVYNHDDSYGLPFPLNKCNQDMTINIQLAQRADMIIAGTSTLQPSLKLHYHVVWSSNENDNNVNNGTSRADVFIPGYNLQNINLNSLNITSSQETSINLDSAFKDGQLLKLIARFSTTASVASKKYFTGSALSVLKLAMSGVDLYSVSNASEATFKDGLNRRADPFYDGYANPYYYEIWGATDPNQISSDQYQCLNLFRNNATLKVSSVSSTLTSGNIIAITKCLYRIDKAGNVVMFTSTSGGN